MIEIRDKVNCSGCAACYNICPKDAIEMKEDEEGFVYPIVDKSKCIDCNLCEKVCPILNKQNSNETNVETLAYIGHNKDEFIRNSSSSGGIFYSKTYLC